jgi:hypothetical protein
MMLQRGWLAIALVVVALQPASADKPLQEWPGVVLRPVFVADTDKVFPGNGFCIKAADGKHYVISCAHLLKDNEWQNVRRVEFMTTDGKTVARAVGDPLCRCKEEEYLPNNDPKKRDVTKDLVIWEVKTIGPVRALKLARTNAGEGDKAWIVGRMHKDLLGREKLYPAEMVDVAADHYWLKRKYDFDPHGFSGGPVVNDKAEVVGNVIAGGEDYVTGASVKFLRLKLKELNITVD